MGAPGPEVLRRPLLAWYREWKRDLPFRRTGDPYAILVAEVMLQRTRVNVGLPYYERFLATFPTVQGLAAAPEADVLRSWEGLGFYRRALNLHRAAKAVVERHRGELPGDYDALRGLPGLGDYTASAVGSIAFGLPIPAVDGNAKRVLARLFGIEEDVSRGGGARKVRALAARLVPATRPGEWNQALMELGATVCRPRAPRCGACPVSGQCVAFAAGLQDELPRAAAREPVPVAPVVFALVRDGDRVLLVRREAGLHAGMYGLPGGERGAGESEEMAVRRHLRSLGVRPETMERMGAVRHTFSHLRWVGSAYRCRVAGHPLGAEWVSRNRMARLPLVPLHRRLIERGGT